tara:strand:+ start:7026 stop:7415 length:390 start_codon:yes stop_codon:yes gene_type:complete
MQDPIADMLTRIRNAQAVSKSTVSIPSSKIKVAIAKVFKEEGYIQDFKITGEEKKPVLEILLKYHLGKPVIEKLQRVSRPALRTYKGVNDLPKVIGGLGTAVVSTSKGVMTDKSARAANVGGEVLCVVW